MNFTFAEGDIVTFKNKKDEMELVKEFAGGVFRAKLPDGAYIRVRAPQLVRVRRPSDEVERVEVDARKKQRSIEKKAREDRVVRNENEFAELQEIGIPTTAKGLPDRRFKAKYTAKTHPKSIKPRGRQNLI